MTSFGFSLEQEKKRHTRNYVLLLRIIPTRSCSFFRYFIRNSELQAKMNTNYLSSDGQKNIISIWILTKCCQNNFSYCFFIFPFHLLLLRLKEKPRTGAKCQNVNISDAFCNAKWFIDCRKNCLELMKAHRNQIFHIIFLKLKQFWP